MSRRRCASESSPRRLEQTASQIARIVRKRERHNVIDPLLAHRVARGARPDQPLRGSVGRFAKVAFQSPNGIDEARFLGNNESMSSLRVDTAASAAFRRAHGRPPLFWLLATVL